MTFAYTIIYVADVANTVDFFHRAFDLPIRFVHESGQYAEMETGTTALAFVAHEIAENNLPGGYLRSSNQVAPFGIEIAFTTPDVPAAVAKAMAAGATIVAEAKTKPWGQVVAYVRSPDGTLVELCTPMG
jgi:lactoylglutathione lyase